MPAESPTDGVVTLRPWRQEDAEGYIAGLGELSFAITDAESGRILGSLLPGELT